MSLSKSSGKGATDLDVDAARLVVERLGPWSRAACACVNRTWREAVERVSFPDASSEHWLVKGQGDSLWMCNLVSGDKRVLKLDLSSSECRWSISRSRVLCSFQGLVFICLECESDPECSLLLGDPLLNKWIHLPMPKLQPNAAAFCSDTSTLMLIGGDPLITATFDLTTAVWNVDGPCNCSNCDMCEYAFLAESLACCLSGVFYCTYGFYSRGGHRFCGYACYDPANDHRWRVTRPDGDFNGSIPFFVMAHSRDKLMMCKMRDDDLLTEFELFEATKESGSNKLVIVPSPLMHDDRISSALQGRFFGDGPVFYGNEDMLFWQRCGKQQVTVVSIKDRAFKDIVIWPGHRNCYYRAMSGTAELLDDLARKLEEKHQKGVIRFALGSWNITSASTRV